MSEITISKINVEEPEFFQSLTNNAVYSVTPSVNSILLQNVNAFTSKNFNNVSFKIDPQPSNLVIKANPIKFNFPLKMIARFVDNRTSDFSTNPIEENSFCLSQFSLYRLCQSINLTFNGCTYTLNNVDRLINALTYYDHIEHLSGNSVMPDNAIIGDFSELTDAGNATKTAVNPFLDYGYSDKFISRKSYITASTATETYQGLNFVNGFCAASATGGNCYQVYTANIELTIPLELFNNEHTSFANISSLQFDFSFNNMLSKLVSFNSASVGSFTTGTGENAVTTNNVTLDSISSAEYSDIPFMSYYRVQMNDDLMNSLSVNGVMSTIPYKISKYAVVSSQTNDCGPQVSQTITFASNTYAYVPKKIFIYVLKNYMTSTAIKNADLATTPANFGVITSLKLYVNNNVLSYSNQQLNSLYHLSEKNHLNTSYCSLYQFQNGIVGSVIGIDIDDFALQNSYSGKPEVVNISCEITVENPSKTKTCNFTAEMIICNDNILLLGPNSGVIKEGLDMNEQITSEISSHYSNFPSHKRSLLGGRIIGGGMHGGGFFKDMGKELIRWVNKLSGPLSILFPEFSGIIGGVKTVANEIGDKFLQGSGIVRKQAKNVANKIKFKGI